jgi:hypothetical protein
MRKIPSAPVAASLILVMATACSPGGASSVARPAGETDFSCAALIYAANRLVDDKTIADADGVIKDKYFMATTSYTTAYAKSEGIKDGMEAFNKVKLEGMKYAGVISSNNRVANDEIATRAKACIAP